MLRQELMKAIEDTRQELNNVLGTYEDRDDDDDVLHLSQSLDELILEYMKLAK